jgi:hypothetical protein
MKSALGILSLRIRCSGTLPKRTFGINNQFSIRAMFGEWAGSDVAVTFSFGGLAIIRRTPCSLR